MSHDIHTLPDAFGIGTDDTLIYFYSSDKPSLNNKVQFSKNLICLPSCGIKHIRTATADTTVNAGEVVMLAGGSVLMSERPHEGAYEAILIFFGNETLSSFCSANRLVLTQKSNTLTELLKFERDAYLQNFCESLRILKNSQSTLPDSVKVNEILNYINTVHPKEFAGFVKMAVASQPHDRLRQVVANNRFANLNIEELAFLCNMSISSFKRHFSTLYNMPPKQYFLQQRMSEARRLLLLQKRPSEIFEGLGYQSLSSFSNEFRKHFGVSPKQFAMHNEPEAKVFEQQAQ